MCVVTLWSSFDYKADFDRVVRVSNNIDILQKTYPKRRPVVSRSSTLVTEITARSAWTSTVSITVTAESPLSVKARWAPVQNNHI